MKVARYYRSLLFFLITFLPCPPHIAEQKLALCLPSLPPFFGSPEFPDKIPLYYWHEPWKNLVNFGDYLSLVLLERIINGPVEVYQNGDKIKKQKVLMIGSILTFASTGDVIWGSGINGNWLKLEYYKFTNLNVRAVRGPLTRHFLMKNFTIHCPEVYGDPALLMPYFFPELKRKEHPSHEYIIIPHYSEQLLFPKSLYKNNVVYPTESWDKVIEKILDSKLVLSGSLHGVIVAEAFGIPARLLRITTNEHIFKFMDYYLGTGRPEFQPAHSVGEALKMGGEAPVQCDLLKLYESFPFEYWPHTTFTVPHFSSNKGIRA